jgi:hypothetical protein
VQTAAGAALARTSTRALAAVALKAIVPLTSIVGALQNPFPFAST